MTSNVQNPHLGTSLDDFLAEDGLLESTNRAARLRVPVWREDREPWQDDGNFRWSLWQVAQSGYDVFVFQDDGPLVQVTDENAGALGVDATEWESEVPEIVLGRIYLNIEPQRISDLYVVYCDASSPDHTPRELCVQRGGVGGDTVYVNGLGYMLCRSHGGGHAIRLGGIGDVYRWDGDGHAIRYDGAGQLQDGECYDLIRHHLRRVAHVAQVSQDAPRFDLGHGNVERSSQHKGIAFRGGGVEGVGGPGWICGDNRRDDRPRRRPRRRAPHHHNWPNRQEREDKELEYFLDSWSASDPSLARGDLVCVSRRERPDRIVRHERTGEEYGVELTSVYLDDRSVIDHHRMVTSEMYPWFIHDPAKIRDYLRRVAETVQEKVDKAQSYDSQRYLMLAVYLNERILSPDFEKELQDFTRRHQAFQRIAPFERIVFTGIGHGVVYP